MDGGGSTTSVTDRTGARLLTRTLLALVLLAGPARSEARAAIAFVQNVGSNGNTTPGTSLSVGVSNGAAVGDTVIVTFAMDPSAGAVSCADSGGNSYSLDADVTNGSGTSGVRTVVCSALSVNEFSACVPTARRAADRCDRRRNE